MDPEIVRIVVGFVLTTVLGGVLGSYLQQRSWKHQNEVRLKEEDLKRAGAVCKSVTQLLDKRLYRMLRLYYACDGYAQGVFPKDVLEQRLRDYDTVLSEVADFRSAIFCKHTLAQSRKERHRKAKQAESR